MRQRTRDELIREIHAWLTKGREPSLDELLTDPGIRLLMACDRVNEAMVRQIASEVWRRISQGDQAYTPEQRRYLS